MIRICDVEKRLRYVAKRLGDDCHLQRNRLDYIVPQLEKNLYVLEYYLTLTDGEVFESLYPNNPSFKSVEEIFPKMGYISRVYYSYLLNKILKRYKYVRQSKAKINHDGKVVRIKDIPNLKKDEDRKELLSKITQFYIYLPLEDSELKLFQYEYSIFFDDLRPKSAFRSLHLSKSHSQWVSWHREREQNNSEAIILQDSFLNNIDFEKSFGFQRKDEIIRNNHIYKVATNYCKNPTGDLDFEPYAVMSDSVIVKKIDINDSSYINTHSFENGLFIDRELKDRNYFTCELSKNLKIPFDDIYLDREELISLNVISDYMDVKQRRNNIILKLLDNYHYDFFDEEGRFLHTREGFFKYIIDNKEKFSLSQYCASLFNLKLETIKGYLQDNHEIRARIVFKRGPAKKLK